MAKTVKADAIGITKEKLIGEIDRIRVELRELANRVPDWVLKGDAVIAARWLEHAQVSYFRPYSKIASKRKSVSELEAMLEEERELIRSLEKPPPMAPTQSKVTNQLDMFL